MRFQSMLENRLDDDHLHHLHLPTSTSSPRTHYSLSPWRSSILERKQHRTHQTKREQHPSWHIAQATVSSRPSHWCNLFPKPPAALSDVVDSENLPPTPSEWPRTNEYYGPFSLTASLYSHYPITTMQIQITQATYHIQIQKSIKIDWQKMPLRV